MQISGLNSGDIIAFQIAPQDADGQINAGRWGMIKVLHVGAPDMVTLALYADIADNLPRLGWLSRPTPLIETRFAALRQSKGDLPSIVTPLAKTSVDLPDARVIKSAGKLTTYEKSILTKIAEGRPVGSYMAWATVSMIIDHEDRAKRDRTTWEADIARRRNEDEARWKAQQQRESQRLKGVTLDKLAAETPFADWSARTAIIPPDYTQAARERFKQMVAALSTLGPKPRRPAVRRELKAMVEWFNEVDGKMGYAIETVEREDIYRALEEVCWACKQKPLVHEIENWRDW